MMMENDLDEDVLFVDHGGPRRNKKKKNVGTKWCHSFTKTICLSLAFLALGLCIAIPGPTLLDLMDRVKTDTTHMLLIFSARSVGYLFGSLVGGFLFDHFDKQLLLASTLFLASIATTIIPWSLTLTVLAVMFSLQGIAMGVLDTGGNAFCVQIWGKKSPPYMQTMHFAYGIGAFIAPLLAHPFLSEHVPGLVLNSTHSLPAGNIPVIFQTPFSLENDHNLMNTSMSHSKRLKRSLSELEEQEAKNSSFVESVLKPNKSLLTNEPRTSSVSTTLFTNVTSVTVATTTTAKKSKKPHHTSSNSADLDGSSIKVHLDKNKVDQSNQQTGNTNSKTTTKVSVSETLSTTKPDILLVNKTIGLENNTEVTTNQSRKDVGPSVSKSSNVVTVVTTASTGRPSVTPKTVISNSITAKIMTSPTKEPITTTSVESLSSKTTSTSRTTTTPSTTTITTSTPAPTTSTLAPTTSTLAPTTSTLAPTTSTSAPTTSTSAPTTLTVAPTTSTLSPTTSTKSVSTTSSSPTTQQTSAAKHVTLTTQPKTTLKKPETTSKPVVKTTVSIETTSKNESNVEMTSTEVTTESHKPETAGNLLTDAIDAVKNMSKIQFAYMIIGLLLLANASIFLTLYCCDKNRNDFTAMEIDKERYYKSSEHMCLRVIILFLMFLFFMSYVGMETTFGGLVMTFTVQYMNGTKHMGAIVTAIFWGSLAAGRGFSIFVARLCRPPSMLIIDLLLVTLGAALLSFAVSYFEFILWVGTLALGLGMSSIFPTAVSWMEQYFTLTGKSTAVLVTGSAIGQMTVPVITGYLFEHYTNMALMYMVIALSLFIAFLFLIMQSIASRTTRTSAVIASSSGFMPLQDEDDMEMDQVNYGTTNKGSARRRFMPTNSDDKYNRLPQDAEDDDDKEEETDLLI